MVSKDDGYPFCALYELWKISAIFWAIFDLNVDIFDLNVNTNSVPFLVLCLLVCQRNAINQGF